MFEFAYKSCLLSVFAFFLRDVNMPNSLEKKANCTFSGTDKIKVSKKYI